MKRNLNIIQINGIKGLIYVGFIVSCLAAGFIGFPSIVCMKLWNFTAGFTTNIPQIGIIQGILLWGIIAGAYFTFRKEKLVVCMKSTDGLNEEELKAVFEEMKKRSREDVFVKNIMKSRQAELKIRNLSESDIPKSDSVSEQKETVESKN